MFRLLKYQELFRSVPFQGLDPTKDVAREGRFLRKNEGYAEPAAPPQMRKSRNIEELTLVAFMLH